jgi:hypothetical protein
MRLLQVGLVPGGLAAFGQHQGEIAERLRFLGAEFGDAAEQDGAVEFAGLPQAPGEYAQEGGIFDLEFGQVGEDAQAEGVSPCLRNSPAQSRKNAGLCAQSRRWAR